MSRFVAGHTLSAVDLSGLVTAYRAISSGTVTLTATTAGTAQDITGASVTFTVTGSAAYAIVWGVFDMGKTANAMQMYGQLDVDGTDQTELALWSDNASTVSERGTVAQTWYLALTAGSHTLKLQGFRTAGAGTGNVGASYTTITALVVDL